MKNSYRFRVFVFTMVIVLLLPMSACGTNLSREYRKGYDTGYEEGYYDGYREGYDDGESHGYDEGHEKGYEQGYEEGFWDDSRRNKALEDYRDYLGDDLYSAYEEGYITKATYDTLMDIVYKNYDWMLER